MAIFSKKTLVWVNIILLIFVLFLGYKAYTLHAKKHLNVILISIDALRSDHIGAYGYSKNTTPNLDTLAKKSTVYTNLRTVVPMTWPSFTALFTGIEPFNTRISSNGNTSISPNTPTLMSILASRGYLTAAYVTNVGNIKPQFGKFNFFLNKSFYYNTEGQERYSMDSSNGSKKVISEAESWLDKNHDNRFFLWVHLMDAHAPYYPDDRYKCAFDKKYCDQILGKSLDELDAEHAKYQFCQNKGVPADTLGKMETLYDGGAAEADYYVGLLLAKIKSLGLDKNSLIIFYADHGEGFDHNYYFNHRGVLYDSAVHIPFMIYNPLSPRGLQSAAQMQNTDVLPTILDALGIPNNFNIDGKKEGESRRYSYSVNNTWTKYSIYDGQYKYIYSLPASCLLNNQTEELYDLKSDPGETKNLITSNSSKKLDLHDKLFSYLSRYNLPPAAGITTPAPMKDGDEGNSNEDIRSLGY